MPKVELVYDDDGTYHFEGPYGEKVHFPNAAEHHLLVYNLMMKLSSQVDHLVLLTEMQKQRLEEHEGQQLEELLRNDEDS